MDAVAGVFVSQSSASKAVQMLRPTIPAERINLLLPTDSKQESRHEGQAVPTTDDMAPVGKGMAATLGGALGLGLGAVILLPAVGVITALGVIGSVLAGVGGAVVGGAVGKAADNALSGGLPVDELYVYEDALRKGRTVVIVAVEGSEQANAVRKVMTESGAETVDAARESWWTGLRDAEKARYSAEGDFGKDEATYRKGFEAALRPSSRGRTYLELVEDLRARFPQLYNARPFVRGFENGVEHYKTLIAKNQKGKAVVQDTAKTPPGRTARTDRPAAPPPPKERGR